MVEDIKSRIEKILENFGGIVGVGFKDLKSGEEFYINGDRKFLTASVFKVFVIIELYRQALEGKINLDERYLLRETDKTLGSGVLQHLQEGLNPTIRDLAKLMMTLSDNTATDIIMKMLGKGDINATIENLGLKNSRVALSTNEILLSITGAENIEEAKKNFEEGKINKGGKWERDFEENDVTTPKDMVKIFEMLYWKKILTPEACMEIIEIMKNCETGEARIKRYLPFKVKVAHKTGTMPSVVNDAGIVFSPKGDYILVVFINGLEYEEQPYISIGEEMISRISKEIYESFILKS